MNITIVERQNIELPELTKDYINQKFELLHKFIQNENALCEVDVTKGGHGGYVVSATITSQGARFNASAERSSINESVDEVHRDLAEQTKKHKDKGATMLRRGGDMIKKMARFGRG
jgi:ribosomal subunit interface protein